MLSWFMPPENKRSDSAQIVQVIQLQSTVLWKNTTTTSSIIRLSGS